MKLNHYNGIITDINNVLLSNTDEINILNDLNFQ